MFHCEMTWMLKRSNILPAFPLYTLKTLKKGALKSSSMAFVFLWFHKEEKILCGENSDYKKEKKRWFFEELLA